VIVLEHLISLQDVVDKFVIVESNFSFTNLPKRLHYAENKDRFKKFHHKILHIAVDSYDHDPTTDPMAREKKLRGAMWQGYNEVQLQPSCDM
jgi:hypothetical protein